MVRWSMFFDFLSAHTNVGRDVDGVRVVNDIIGASSFDVFDKMGAEKFFYMICLMFLVSIELGLSTSIEYAVQILRINQKIYESVGGVR